MSLAWSCSRRGVAALCAGSRRAAPGRRRVLAPSAPDNWFSASAPAEPDVRPSSAPAAAQASAAPPARREPRIEARGPYEAEDAARDARIFARLRDEAEGLANSALLGASVRAQVLEADSLADVIAEILACRLARGAANIMLPRDELRTACADALRGDPRVGADITAILARDPAAISYLQCVMFFKGFHAVQAHRVAARYWRGAAGDLSYRHAALAIQNRVSELWAVDIHPNAVVGGGLLLDHATGVVVGETAEIGDDCTILHAVTLGGTGKERGDRHPKIGDGCTLGAGATILGNIKVGDGATVGSQAVVTKDVPESMTVVGLNKLLDPALDTDRQKVVRKRSETWQYEVGAYDGYSI